MARALSILNELREQGGAVVVHGDNLRVESKRDLCPEAGSVLQKIVERKDEILALLRSGNRVIDRHPVKTIVWETEKAIVFQDPEGRYWRYMYEWKRTWPIVIVTRIGEGEDHGEIPS